MAIEFTCPECKQKMNLPDSAAGKRTFFTKCSCCGAAVTIPGASAPGGLRPLDFDLDDLVAPEQPPSQTAGSGLMDISELMGDQSAPTRPAAPFRSTDDSEFVLEPAEPPPSKNNQSPPAAQPAAPRPVATKPPELPKPAVIADCPATAGLPPPMPSAQGIRNHTPSQPPEYLPLINMSNVPPPAKAAPPVEIVPFAADAAGAADARMTVMPDSLLGDCGRAFAYGLRSFGAMIILIVVTWLILIGTLLVIRFCGPYLAGQPLWVPLSMAFGLLVAIFIACGWGLQFQADIIQTSVANSEDCPPLPQWDLGPQLLLALRYVGLVVVYVLPVITIPLLPLGCLAMGHVTDGRAYNLVWAARAAARRPGALLLVWAAIFAWTIVVGLISIVVSMISAAVMASIDSSAGIAVDIFTGVIRISLVVLALSIISRCIGRMGYRCGDVLDTIPSRPNVLGSMGFLALGLVLTAVVHLLAGSSIDRNKLDALRREWAALQARPARADDRFADFDKSYGNMRLAQKGTIATITIDGSQRQMQFIESADLKEFESLHLKSQKLCTILQDYKRTHQEMPPTVNQLIAPAGANASEFAFQGWSFHVNYPLEFKYASDDVALVWDAVIFGQVRMLIRCDGQVCYDWADGLEARLSRESQHRTNLARGLTTPSPTPVAPPAPWPGPPVVHPTPTPRPTPTYSEAERNILALANALKAFAISRQGRFPASLDEFKKAGLVKDPGMMLSTADSTTPYVYLPNLELFGSDRKGVLVYDPIPSKSPDHEGQILFVRAEGGPEYLSEKEFKAELEVSAVRSNLRAFYALVKSYHDVAGRPPASMDELLASGLVKDASVTRGPAKDAPPYVYVSAGKWNSWDVLAFDPQPYGSKYYVLKTDGDIQTYDSMDRLTRDLDWQKERARITAPRPLRPTATPTPTPGVTLVKGEKLTVDWPVADWQSVTDHPFNAICQVVKELKVKQYSAVVGVNFGPQAKSKTDEPFVDYRKQILDFWIAKSGAPSRNEQKQKIGDVEYDRINSTGGGRIATVLIGIRDGRCVSYWYASNTTNCFTAFIDGFDQAAVKVEGGPATKPAAGN